MPWRRGRIGLRGLAAILAIVVAALAWAAADRYRTGHHRAEMLAQNGFALIWIASQFEREGLMLAKTLHRHAAAPSSDTLQAIDLQLARLYSRIDALRADSEADALISSASGRERIARAGDRLAAVEMMINGLGRDSTAAEALDALEPMLMTAQRISNLANQLGTDMLSRQVAIRQAVEIELMVFGLIAALCALLAIAAVATDMIWSDRALQRATEARELAIASQAVAEAADRAKTDFLGNLSHVLHTPINAIMRHAERMGGARAEPPDAGRMAEHATAIRRSGSILTRQIGQLLNLPRIEAGALAIDPQPIDLAALLTEMSDLVEQNHAERSLSLRRTILAPVGPAMVDATALQQVVLNLLSNAASYGAGPVDLSAEPDLAGGYVIRVADHGPGFPQARRDAAVQPPGPAVDAQGQGHRTRGGLGLGLAISARLMALHGGRLDIGDTPGGGTTVSLALPPECFPERSSASAARAPA